MSENLNFRSAFNGFHREDVVHYIEYLNTKHAAEVNQLNTQLEQLRSQNTVPADVSELQDQLSAAQEINDRLQARIAELEARCSEAGTAAEEAAADHSLEERCQELERQLKEAQAAAQFPFTQELEAYRRAERAEREAKERAELVYRQANGALADATVKVDEAFSQIGDLTDRVSQQLSQLQQAVTVSRQALAEASASLYSVTSGNK